jgi:hypothetical protein
MFTYVTDVCWHALVIPCFRIVVIFRYNEGSSFVKLKSDLYRRAFLIAYIEVYHFISAKVYEFILAL